MKAGERVHEWASGVKLGHPLNGFRTRYEPRIKWKWTRIGVTTMPWCPSCGAIVAQVNGQRVHEDSPCGGGELFIEPDEDEDQEQDDV